MRESAQNRIKAVGAVIHGHFAYAAGGHGDIYVDKNLLFTQPGLLSFMGQALAEECIRYLVQTIKLQNGGSLVVLGPAMGAAIFSPWVALHLEQCLRIPVFSAFAEKDKGGGFVLNRGYRKLIADKDVITLDDVLTTGKSAKAVVDLIRAVGGNVLGVASIVNRSVSKVNAETFGVPFLATLLDLDLNNWTEDECPLCKDGVPVNTEVGHGGQFLEKKHAKALIAMQTG